ncbi:hypothetical protein CYY_000965 [Polysphondylium violaceum]|uniref:Nascent polypeptide-associated complex subunit alpha-like UBA domain-containing protein n=1 Tax=Polysphondylium violaceum TaxID=133409 RepID=A0A8J4PYV8_9MYCE|nr:hypothetical protein CYY_000965 [Polysphondylium violaceum]
MEDKRGTNAQDDELHSMNISLENLVLEEKEIKKSDIEFISYQMNVSIECATSVLRECKGDVVQALCTLVHLCKEYELYDIESPVKKKQMVPQQESYQDGMFIKRLVYFNLKS